MGPSLLAIVFVVSPPTSGCCWNNILLPLLIDFLYAMIQVLEEQGQQQN